MKMKKLSMVVGSCLFAASSIQANEFFVGAGINTGGYYNLTGDHAVKGSQFGGIGLLNFKAGLQNENFRVYGNFGDRVAASKEQSVEGQNDLRWDSLEYRALTANADFFAPVHERVKLFVGPHVGLGFAEVERYYQPEKDKQKHNVKAMVFGAQAGAIFDVNDNFSIETGYRHSWTKIDETFDYTFTRNNVKLEEKEQAFKLDQVGSVYLSANYTF